MSTDLEARLREALHVDAQRARLVNPQSPPARDVVSISEAPPRSRSGRRLVALAAAIALIVGAGVVIFQDARDRTGDVTTSPGPPTPSSSPATIAPESFVFFDGEVSGSAAAPWEVVGYGQALTLGQDVEDGRLQIGTDPYPGTTGCETGLFFYDAAALARAIRSDPDLEATAPERVSIGGIEGMAMDVTLAPEATTCPDIGSTLVLAGFDGDFWTRRLSLDQGSRARLYLVDMPEASTTRILAIAVVAPESRFDAVTEAAAPIIESIEFHPRGS